MDLMILALLFDQDESYEVEMLVQRPAWGMACLSVAPGSEPSASPGKGRLSGPSQTY